LLVKKLKMRNERQRERPKRPLLVWGL
jgi:hypothetical protein